MPVVVFFFFATHEARLSLIEYIYVLYIGIPHYYIYIFIFVYLVPGYPDRNSDLGIQIVFSSYLASLCQIDIIQVLYIICIIRPPKAAISRVPGYPTPEVPGFKFQAIYRNQISRVQVPGYSRIP